MFKCNILLSNPFICYIPSNEIINPHQADVSKSLIRPVSGKHFPGPDFPLWKWEKLTHFIFLVKLDSQHFPFGNIIKMGKVNLNFIRNIIFNIFCHSFFFKWSIIKLFKKIPHIYEFSYVFVWYSNKILEQNKRVVKIGPVSF